MTRKRTRRAAALLSAFLLAACGGKPASTVHDNSGPTSEQKSSAKQRESVAITVYNGNYGLVREIRNVKLGTGRVSLEFADVSAHIQPETVHIRSLSGAGALNVLEQNYRYDLLSPEKLLEKYVGKKISVYRYNEKLGTDEKKTAEVLAVEQGVVLRIDGEVTFNFPGRYAFPEVPENLIAKPTLVWLLGSTAAQQKIEVSYLTQNLNWHADYVFVINQDDTLGDLTGWVTLQNQSGTSYENATLKLVAGDVQKLVSQTETAYAAAADMPMARVQAPQFKEEGFFEYHLYTLERPTSLLEKEQKQVSLLEAHDAKLKKKLIFYGADAYYRGRYGQVVSNQKVGVYLDIENKKENGLGMPLPKGTVRVYKADSSKAQQFIGEDAIDHTPKDEKLRIKMGEAFDIVGDRKQMSWHPLGSCVSESSWEISLRNHKDKSEEVEVYEPVGGDWTVTQSSHKAQRKDAHTFTFTVGVPANAETKVTYTVRVRWC